MIHGFQVAIDRFGFAAISNAPQYAILFADRSRPAYSIAEDYAARWKKPKPATFGVAVDGAFRFLPESPAEWNSMGLKAQFEMMHQLAAALKGFLVAYQHPPGVYFGLRAIENGQVKRYRFQEFRDVVRSVHYLERGVLCGFHPPEELHEVAFLETHPPCNREQVLDLANRTNWSGCMTCGFWDQEMAWLTSETTETTETTE